MTLIEKTLKETKVLKGWDGYDVLPNVEEDPNDIWMLVKYNDHGDDFLVVGTRDGNFYEYGLYINRKRTFSGIGKFYGLREPKLYKKLDERAEVSNKIFFAFERSFAKSHMSFGYDRKYFDESDAQFEFNSRMNWIRSLSNSCEVFFDYEKKKKDIKYWLELNNILTKENEELLEKTPFHNKIGEYKVIGEAGKIECHRIYGDEVEYIIVNKKKINPRKVTHYAGSDEWGFTSICLPLNGFRPSKQKVEG